MKLNEKQKESIMLYVMTLTITALLFTLVWFELDPPKEFDCGYVYLE